MKLIARFSLSAVALYRVLWDPLDLIRLPNKFKARALVASLQQADEFLSTGDSRAAQMLRIPKTKADVARGSHLFA